jgi:16S rRNA processing protein RimM
MLDIFTAGILGKPFGLRGEIALKTFSPLIENLTGNVSSLESCPFRLPNGSVKNYKIESIEVGRNRTFIKLCGIDSPEDAKSLLGAEMLVERGNASPLEENEFYIEDLKGLELVDAGQAGEVYGKIVDVIEGAGSLLLVELAGETGAGAEGGGAEKKQKTALVPFRSEFIGEVDMKKRTCILLAPWILR